MRIQHNIAAMNSYRNLSANNTALNKNLEKLSSGYKINRAGDDAAGLAISEKMRAQITGLETAQKNVKDGISMIKTAEGALTEVHDMLNRMVELATQAANGTYDTTVDRTAIQSEANALLTEINRIADTSNFNGKMLFGDGKNVKNITNYTLQIGDTSDSANILDLGDVSNPVISDANLKSMAGSKNNDLKNNIAKLDIAGNGDPDVTAAQDLIKYLKGDNATGPSTGIISQVSTLRAELGAVQNRLEHTQNNLGVMTENIQDAESTIRDTDVASEMMAYTKNNILIQSAQAMLAQANQVPQGVLQLMQ